MGVFLKSIDPPLPEKRCAEIATQIQQYKNGLGSKFEYFE